jgi:hypothetical protein
VARAAPVAPLALLLLAGLAAGAGDGLAQTRPSQPQKAEPPAKYDQYEPSRTRRLRAEVCGRHEETVGAYCVKACQKGYVLLPDVDPPRCRGVEPLPQGQIPGPIRKEIGEQPKLPPPPPGAPAEKRHPGV